MNRAMKISVLRKLILTKPDFSETKRTFNCMNIRMTKFLKIFRKIILTVMLLVPLFVAAQDDKKPTKKEKKALEKKEQRAQDSKKAEIAGKKRHMKLQD